MENAGNAAKKSKPVAMPERIGLAEDKRHDWVVDIPIGVSLEQLMEPAYWALCAAQMDPMDHIEARAEDGSWVAYLIVAMCERTYAIVVLDRCVKMTADIEKPATAVKHKVEWKGPHMKYCVIRTADSQAIKSEFRTKDEATEWMNNHERTAGI